MSDLFPPFEPATNELSREQVINSLLKIRSEGHAVYTEGDGYVIQIEEDLITIQPHQQNAWTVGMSRRGVIQTYGYAKTEQELETLIVFSANSLGYAWPFRPTSGRLAALTPATNYQTISSLIGGAKVEAVFDPYLDNNSLATLINILSFGSGGIADGVRLLSSTLKTQGTIPQFSQLGVTAWLNQLGITGEARVVAPRDEHRRFILLTSGQSLIIGPSLNSIHKNEAVSVEPSSYDRQFFDSTWSLASPL